LARQPEFDTYALYSIDSKLDHLTGVCLISTVWLSVVPSTYNFFFSSFIWTLKESKEVKIKTMGHEGRTEGRGGILIEGMRK